MSSDRLFADKKDLVGNFAFDRETALVFDDMLNRSALLCGDSAHDR